VKLPKIGDLITFPEGDPGGTIYLGTYDTGLRIGWDHDEDGRATKFGPPIINHILYMGEIGIWDQAKDRLF